MKNQDSIKVSLPYGETFKHCQKLLEENNFKTTKLDEEAGKILASSGISWESFGEKVNVELEDLGNQQTLVKLSSKSKFPITIVDWGKNNENVKKIIEGLQRL